jgi:pilus assembly protein CpaB
MKTRALLTFLCGIGLASTSVYLVHEKLGDGPDTGLVAAEPSIVVGSVVVASTDLAFGHRLRGEHLREAPWPVEARPEGSFETIEELLGDPREERVVLKAMSKGEPVMTNKVSGFGARATLSIKLEDGKRAFSIRVNDVSGVAGFLLPGDRVDVLLTRQIGNTRDLVTDVILQNTVVLGIDQLSEEDREKPHVARTATVEVTPRDAQKLALAMQAGTLSLALRNVAAADEPKLHTVNIGDVVGRAAPEAAKPTVRVLRGSEVSIEPVLSN